jgi:hypothetical protein
MGNSHQSAGPHTSLLPEMIRHALPPDKKTVLEVALRQLAQGLRWVGGARCLPSPPAA